MIRLVLALARHALRAAWSKPAASCSRACTCCPAHRPTERLDVRGAVPR